MHLRALLTLFWLGCGFYATVSGWQSSTRGRQTRLKCYQTSHCADSGSVCKFLADLPVEEDDAQLDYDTDVSQFGPVEMNDTETTTTSVNTTTVAPDTSTTEDTSSSDDVETTAVEEATERPDFTLEITDENGNPIDLFEPVSPIIVKDPGTTSSPTTELSGVDDRTDGPRAGSRNTPSEAKRSSAGYCVCDERERYACNTDLHCQQRYGQRELKCIPTVACPSSTGRVGYCRTSPRNNHPDETSVPARARRTVN